MSRAAQVPYSPELFERIARLCIRMGDLAEAGRWYAVIASTDEAAPRAIEVFFGRCNGDKRQILSRLPLALDVDKAQLPAAVRERFPTWTKARKGYIPSATRRRPLKPGHVRGRFQSVAAVGCAAVVVFMLACTVVGFSTIMKGFVATLRD